MKKIYEWYEYLPSKIRDRAQAYFFESHPLNELEHDTDSLSGALWGGFIWIDTVEGQLYWEKIANKYKNFNP